MKNPITPIVASFITAFFVTLVGVIFFFDPITKDDQSIVSVHPGVGLLVYVTLCVWLFVWSTKLTGSAFKGAFLVAAPQFVLILDLTLRGSRGVITAIAGSVLLAFTWLIVAAIYSRLSNHVEKSENT